MRLTTTDDLKKYYKNKKKKPIIFCIGDMHGDVNEWTLSEDELNIILMTYGDKLNIKQLSINKYWIYIKDYLYDMYNNNNLIDNLEYLVNNYIIMPLWKNGRVVDYMFVHRRCIYDN